MSQTSRFLVNPVNLGKRFLSKRWVLQFLQVVAAFSLSMVTIHTPAVAEVVKFDDFQKAISSYLERPEVDFEEKQALVSLTRDLTENKFQTMQKENQAVVTRLLEDIREYDRVSQLGVKAMMRQGIDSSLGILAGVMIGAWQADCTLNPRRYAIVDSAMTDDEISYMATHGVDQTSFAGGAYTCIAYGIVKYKRLAQSLERKKTLPQKINDDLRQLLDGQRKEGERSQAGARSAQVAPAPDSPLSSGKK